MTELRGKTVLVTGASAGLGAAVAKATARAPRTRCHRQQCRCRCLAVHGGRNGRSGADGGGRPLSRRLPHDPCLYGRHAGQRGAIERVALHGSLEDADRPPISVGLANKLIYLSVFVAALPLAFFTVSIIFKVDLMFTHVGADVTLSAQAPLLLWIASVVFVLFGGALGMSILTAQDVTRSARKLIGAMREVEAGNLERHLHITATEEYAEPFQGFNRMTDSLREEMRILEISHDLAGELDLDRLLVRIVGAATELLDAERSSLFLYDSRSDELWSRVAEGVEIKEIRFAADEGIAGAVLRSSAPANVADAYAELYRGFNLMTESLREEVRILEISHDLAGELDLDCLLSRIINATTELLDAERSSLLIYDTRSNELWSRVAEGLERRSRSASFSTMRGCAALCATCAPTASATSRSIRR